MKKFLIFALIGALTAALLILPGCTTPGEDMTPIDNNGNPMYDTTIYEFPEGINFLSESSSSVTIEATVTPETALNKQVDWLIQWSNPTSTYASGKTVTDYVTVTPDADGSRIATVSCLQAFDENIIITVVTREGGFTAQCVVTFAGVPTGLTIDTNISTVIIDGSPITTLLSNNTYNFDLALSSEFGTIGDDYGDFEIKTFIAFGQFYTKYKAPMGWIENEPTEAVNVNDIKHNYITPTISGNTLTIETGNVLESYKNFENGLKVGENVGGDIIAYPTFYEWNQSYYEGPLDYYLYIKVEETNTGLTDDLFIHIGASVQNCSVNPNEIIF